MARINQSTNGADQLIGDENANTLSGGAGNDRLDGQWGNDSLSGAGSDRLQGGTDNDVFVWATPSEGSDSIVDFSVSDDQLSFSAGAFGGGLTTGVLEASRFVLGTTANAEVAQFVYNQTTGQLWWDEDGTGTLSGTLIATFDTKPVLTAADFQIVA